MGLIGRLGDPYPAWVGQSVARFSEDDKLILAYGNVISSSKGALGNLYRLWLQWDKPRKLKYIEHMKRCAAADPERFVLFSDIVASATAHSLEGL